MRTLRFAVAATLVGTALAVPTTSADAATKTLRIGALFPKSGNLQILGPPAIAGVKLAIKDINAAGGVFGRDVQLEVADSGDSTNDIANAALKKLLKNGADAIVGPTASSISKLIRDRIAATETPTISPSATSNDLSRWTDNGMFFRTAPRDAYQGTVVAKLAKADGRKKLAILARNDSYGTVLAAAAEKEFKAGGGTVVHKKIYSVAATSFAKAIDDLKASKPDAIFVVGFGEVELVAREMRSEKLLPVGSTRDVYFADGSVSNSYPLPSNTLTGVQGVIPGDSPSDAFLARVKKIDPKLRDFSYAAEAYDATVMLALAATAAKSDGGKAIAAKLPAVSRDGTVCKSFKSCVSLIEAGKSVDYDGQSGKVPFDALGDVRHAPMGVYEFGSDNRFRFAKSLSGPVPGA